MGALTCRIKEYIQPFERHLALQELRALVKGPVVPLDGSPNTASMFSIQDSSDTEKLREALAYWRSVGDDENGLTVQLRSEASAMVARNGSNTEHLPETVRSQVPGCLPRKRCLRYATHGLHEYRGKFFPQLVRALMNIAELEDGAVVLDPMCGSGTTPVEARLSGRQCYGLDMNPLSVFISNVKCAALALQASDLVTAYGSLHDRLRESPAHDPEEGRSRHLADSDRMYLERWFNPKILVELDRIEQAIRRLPEPALRNFFLVCLSNILRKVSWQKTDDLRVRREMTDFASGKAIEFFLAEALRSTRVVAAFLGEREPIEGQDCRILQGNARRAAQVWPILIGRVDAVITSPPYATALPYIDTDRLSLIYLGLLPRCDHRSLDAKMIGNREITTGERDRQWSNYLENKELLPKPTCQLIEQINLLNQNSEAGFRRRNLSALLSKYFFDMRETIQQIYALLRPGGSAFLVVGNNRTIAGGQQIEIRTADHLGRLAEDIGFRQSDSLSMDMLVSRDIFRKNAMSSEKILRFEKELTIAVPLFRISYGPVAHFRARGVLARTLGNDLRKIFETQVGNSLFPDARCLRHFLRSAMLRSAT